MSGRSALATSLEASDSEHGVSPPADESTASESPEPGQTQPGLGAAEAKREAKATALPFRDFNGKPESASRSGSRKRQRQISGPKAGLNGGLHAYRDLLNEVIEEVAGRAESLLEPLPPSQIGASLWTSSEKDTFFRKLSVCRIGDLAVLSQAVGTKSQAECHVYLRLLQDGLLEANVTLHPKDLLSKAGIPAAAEVREECETALEDAAEQLSLRVEQHDADMERNRHGDLWLIDEELAATLDMHAEAEENLIESAGEASINDNGDHTAAPQATTRESPVDVGDNPVNTVLSKVPAARLLQPTSLLQLSANIFMNGPLGTGSNWQDIVGHDGSSSGPAILRTAFNDLHNVTVSLTRRLVQATLFQAMSRLRAGDATRPDWEPPAEVRDIDVRTAIDVLGMNSDWKTHRATVARRSGIDVYSGSEKFQDGRTGTKNGVKLTHEEVERELGLHVTPEQGKSDRSQCADREKRETEPEEFGIDSDAFTVESYTGESSSGGERGSDDDGADEEERPSKKRKRASSPRSHDRTEDHSLEFLDQQASLVEERRLWEILVQTPPAAIEPEVPPGFLPTTKRPTAVADNWRNGLEYEPEWAYCTEHVIQEDFEHMRATGNERKARRLAAQNELHGGRAGINVEVAVEDEASPSDDGEDDATDE